MYPSQIRARFTELVLLSGGTRSSAYGVIQKAINEYGDEPALDAALRTVKKEPSEPISFFRGILRKQFDVPTDKYQIAAARVAERHGYSYRTAFSKFVGQNGQDAERAKKAYDHVINIRLLGAGHANAGVLHTIVAASEQEDLVAFFLLTSKNGNAWASAGRYVS